MSFPTTLLILLPAFFFLFSDQSTAQSTGFRCTSTTPTCTSLIDYKLPNTTTISAVQSLFQIKNLRSLIAANSLPTTTNQTTPLAASQILKIPFPCFCQNGSGISNRHPIYSVVPDDGLYHIAAGVFSNLVTFQQIQKVNNIPDADKIEVGQKLWIPLPCSCDDVDGDVVMHYGHLVAAGSTVGGIAAEFNTTESTLLKLNGMNSSNDLKADSVIDVPLKVCTSLVKSDSMDYPLLVPNGAYTFTANNCVSCQCNATNNWILECTPSGLSLPRGQTCHLANCTAPSETLNLGNTTSVSNCIQSRCAYAGYRNGTILTTLSQESTCPAGNNNDNNGSGNNNDNNGSENGVTRWRSSFVVGSFLLAFHLLHWDLYL